MDSATTLLTLPPFILASGSPRRVELLRQLIPEFGVVRSDAHELHDASLGVRRLCEVNAERKALQVSGRYPEHLVLGADTLVWLDGEPIGKPADAHEAKVLLEKLSGRVHEVVTGVCLVHESGRRMRLFSESTRVKFRGLGEDVVTEYLSKVDTLDKAGGYAIQEHGDLIVEQIEGSMSNVIGLPLEPLRNAREQWRRPNQAG
jgi:septum formation protein